MEVQGLAMTAIGMRLQRLVMLRRYALDAGTIYDTVLAQESASDGYVQPGAKSLSSVSTGRRYGGREVMLTAANGWHTSGHQQGIPTGADANGNNSTTFTSSRGKMPSYTHPASPPSTERQQNHRHGHGDADQRLPAAIMRLSVKNGRAGWLKAHDYRGRRRTGRALQGALGLHQRRVDEGQHGTPHFTHAGRSEAKWSAKGSGLATTVAMEKTALLETYAYPGGTEHGFYCQAAYSGPAAPSEYYGRSCNPKADTQNARHGDAAELHREADFISRSTLGQRAQPG